MIVPSYEAWPILHRTLAAILQDLREFGQPWQVIVVDNESKPSLTRKVERLASAGEQLIAVRRLGLDSGHFQPGAARNVGIELASYDCLVFLDADCVPSPGMLRRYATLVGQDRRSVFIGHRVFVDADGFDPAAVACDRFLFNSAPRVASASNYGEVDDRRLAELRRLDAHPRPYDCLFGCNFALHRECLGELRFDSDYDGYWGYEDIDLGLRLHRAGRKFSYVPENFVFHQEGTQLPDDERKVGRMRNLALFEDRCPGFIAYRAHSRRPGALPEETRACLNRAVPTPLGPRLVGSAA